MKDIIKSNIQDNSGSNLLIKYVYMLRTLIMYSIVTGYINSAAMNDDINYLCSSTTPPKTKTIIELYHNISEDDTDAAYKALDDSAKEKDPAKASQLLKIAICGPGESEFSKQFTELVTDNENRFYENDELFIGNFYEVKDKCLRQILDFDLINNCRMNRCQWGLGLALSRLAALMIHFGKVNEAIIMQKKAIFWMLFRVRENRAYDKYLCKELRKLREMQNVTR
jgi:hypothetical protein